VAETEGEVGRAASFAEVEVGRTASLVGRAASLVGRTASLAETVMAER